MFCDGDAADALRRRLPIRLSHRHFNVNSARCQFHAPDPDGCEIVMEVMFAFVLIILLLVGALSLRAARPLTDSSDSQGGFRWIVKRR
jgi:hypothetical protein